VLQVLLWVQSSLNKCGTCRMRKNVFDRGNWDHLRICHLKITLNEFSRSMQALVLFYWAVIPSVVRSLNKIENSNMFYFGSIHEALIFTVRLFFLKLSEVSSPWWWTWYWSTHRADTDNYLLFDFFRNFLFCVQTQENVSGNHVRFCG